MKRKYEIAVLSKGSYARTVRLYVPKKSDRAIIMHDGQNVFCDEDAAYKKSWRAIDVLRSAGIKNTAIIGIDCAPSRYDDYFPFPTELEKFGFPLCGGNTKSYAEYIEQTIVPYLDKRFGFKFYGMAGSSAGANMTAYYAAKCDSRFKAYAMFSAALFVSPDAYGKFLDETRFDPNALYSVYAGGSEDTGEIPDPEIRKKIPQLYVDDAFALVNALRRSGAKNITFTYD
ncbi:MAG: hypothetical protein K2L54_00325, partial [Clostridiales bacterium]|nr:hypothetical protein [Clostridiales bacterium]